MTSLNNISKIFLSLWIGLSMTVSMLTVCPIFVSRDQISKDNFTILHTNDEHSSLVPTLSLDQPEAQSGGFARLATVISAIRAEKDLINEPVLLLSGGDFMGETAYGWLSTWGDAAELKLMQELGYDAVTIGNHEYDFGPDRLAAYLEEAGYPDAHDQTLVLAANTQPPATHPLNENELIRSSGMITLENGLKVGLFGLIGENAISVTGDTGDIQFTDQQEAARLQVDTLQAKGADIIIVLSHSGEDEDIALAKAVPDIDIIIGGHSHTLLSEPIQEGNTLIVQAGSQTRYLGRIELAYDRENQSIRLRNDETQKPAVIEIDDQILADPVIQEQIDSNTQALNTRLSHMTEKQVTDVHRLILRSSFILSHRPAFEETPAGNFITDGMRLVTEAIIGQPVDVAVMANGNIRSSLIPGQKDGTISFYDVTNMVGLGYGVDGYPGYSIASIYLTGEELRRVLEVAALLPVLMGDDYFLQFSGIRYQYNPKDTVLFTIPVMDQPLPSLHAVKKADLYRGDGSQSSDPDAFVPLKRGDETLYHLVTDTYILSFLPMAGELLPQLTIVPKNEHGEPVPIERFQELTVPYQGRELKVWETVALYAQSLPEDQSNLAVLPDVYQSREGRIEPVQSIPLIVFLIVALLVIIAVLVFGIRFAVRLRRRHRSLAKSD